jgi:hypothetical protein
MPDVEGSDKDWWGSDFDLGNIDELDTFDGTLFTVNQDTDWSVASTEITWYLHRY